MGVKDLWQLLAAVGRRVSIETLETKILAIDVSIWITQFIKAMRDEEGKTMHNAHLIGSIRRILKLLFHRIRPIFVFDGVAPSIKQRTLRRRQTFRDNQDGNFKKLGQKLLMSRLKQEAIRSQITDSNPSNNSSSAGRFASSFVPAGLDGTAAVPSAAAASGALQSPGASAPAPGASPQGRVEELDLSAEVEWEDGYADLAPGKALPGGRGDDDSVESEDEADWDLPANADDIDVAVLASLPTQMRKDLIEAARRRERARRRSNYLPVAANPNLYSQTQVANFLRTSKFNQRVMEVQEAALDAEGGLRIASEGSKKYLFQPGGAEQARAAVEPAAAATLGSAHSRGGAAVAAASSSSFFPEDSDEDADETMGPSVSAWIAQSATATYSPSSQPAARSSPALPEVKPGPAAVVDLSSDAAVAEYSEKHIPKYSFTQDPVPEAGEGESDYGDVEWESGLSSEDQSQSDNDIAAITVSSADQEFLDSKDASSASASVSSSNPIMTAEAAVTLEPNPAPEQSNSDFIHRATPEKSAQFDRGEESWGRFEATGEPPAPHSDRSALEQAVATAAKMNDWAGREMQRFLKSHLRDRGESATAAVSGADSANRSAEDVRAGNDFDFPRPHSIYSPPDKKVEHIDMVDFVPEVSVPVEEEKVRSAPALTNEELKTLLSAEENQQRVDRERSRAYQRDSAVLTAEMKEEVMELLDAFGLPYMVAPSEAEAQCAVLERLGLVDGIVTEDSDSFLFGAKNVYKNIFQDGKYVEAYFLKDLEAELNLDQESLIAMAYLLGSDYTDGIKGVGIVNSTEVIQAFMLPPTAAAAAEAGSCDDRSGSTALFGGTKFSADRIVASLQSFKEWVDNYAMDFIAQDRRDKKSSRSAQALLSSDDASAVAADEAPFAQSPKRRRLSAAGEDSGGVDREAHCLAAGTDEERAEKMRVFSENHKNSRAKWFVPSSFPDRAVCEAYLKPEVNTSTQSFSWPVPELAKVSSFCKNRLGWTENEISERVVPVITKCLEPLAVQSTLESFFTRYQDNSKFAKIKSKRLQNALAKAQPPAANPPVVQTPNDQSSSSQKPPASQSVREDGSTTIREKRTKKEKKKKHRNDDDS